MNKRSIIRSFLWSFLLPCSLCFTLSVSPSFSQTKPTPAKAATTKTVTSSKPTAAKAATTKTAASTKPTAAKPATTKVSATSTKTSTGTKPSTTKTTSSAPAKKSGAAGQTVTSQPAPARATSPANAQPQKSSTPEKVATAPPNQYKAVDNQTTAKPKTVAKSSVYGLGFNQKDKLLNVGVGLTSYYHGTPIGLSFEAGIHKDISIGAQLDYSSGQANDYGLSNWGYKAYYIGVRGSYHLNRVIKVSTSKLDLYVGLGLGYKGFQWNDRSYGYGYNYGSGVFPNYFVGAKYYFAPKISGFAELGYTGISSSRIGVAFKF